MSISIATLQSELSHMFCSYHCLLSMVVPWYTMVYHDCTMALFIRYRLRSSHWNTLRNATKQKKNKTKIIIFIELQMIFKSMHQCDKNQMAQYLTVVVQFYNYWSLLNARHWNFSQFCPHIISYISSMMQNMTSTKCGSHVLLCYWTEAMEVGIR